ncbi:MAG: U32 family peptidase [Melioribacteraceae bacterium]|nr:U32 family peptidase [Melioribacteraceae bacterium]
MNNIKLELLSPAKDLECGIAAINCGADAVYIGAPNYGARVGAGNSIEDIEQLVKFAHRFWVKVYVTVNTILFDDELEEAQSLINKLYEIGVDAVIFQDMALLEMDLPPIQLYASTQTHNYEIERIKILDEAGIKRIILARELTIDEIKEIKKEIKAELEFFVHGALCVSLSGQCYMSHELTGRSANRGECAQNCRMPYSLIDSKGKTLIENKHLLSLRDLNLSEYLNDLVNAGITSFKIEGRLKDASYVKNITAFYRAQLDDIIKNNHQYEKASSGYSVISFEPDPEKTFNRGYTSYFINDRGDKVSSHDSPKSTGKYLGKVTETGKEHFIIGTSEKITNGDGICFYNQLGELLGMNVNRAEGQTIFTKDLLGIKKGTKIYRNFDHAFDKELSKESYRKISVDVFIEDSETGISIQVVDSDNVSVKINFDVNKEIAENPIHSMENIKKQFLKSGDTIFSVNEVHITMNQILFFPVKLLNQMRRTILNELENERLKTRKIDLRDKELSTTPLKNINPNNKSASQDQSIDYRSNVVNNLSEKFYSKLGFEKIEPGFEKQKDFTGKVVMTCKYCIKDELNLCPFDTDKRVDEPLFLVNESRKYLLNFNCKDCLMEIIVA